MNNKHCQIIIPEKQIRILEIVKDPFPQNKIEYFFSKEEESPSLVKEEQNIKYCLIFPRSKK